ncbi:helix-turn-helix domain-containing protein [Cysteiniphilum sp. JM-1]|uniref:helix-turn-helix domain-containing protein n=1 Tax=Cysteiniphilum sp. JM-1 TaxID=2610891 RepID=UPI00124691BA|nr:helix-turn-helix domain-containing protein [Cysteiniphilum sp. JM-1]
MNSFQQQLKHLREQQQLTVDGVASRMSFTAQTIQMLEDTDDLFSLELPTQSLKNYYRKYGECLGMPERKIVSMLNRIDYLDYKRSRKGKMKPFDYLNRLVILVLIALLGHTVYTLYQQQKANALKQSVVTLSAPVVSQSTEQENPTTSPSANDQTSNATATPNAATSNTTTNSVTTSNTTGASAAVNTVAPTTLQQNDVTQQQSAEQQNA